MRLTTRTVAVRPHLLPLSCFPLSRRPATIATIVTMPFRILTLLLCLLVAGPMSTSAHAIARPETRVGDIFSSPPQIRFCRPRQNPCATRWKPRLQLRFCVGCAQMPLLPRQPREQDGPVGALFDVRIAVRPGHNPRIANRSRVFRVCPKRAVFRTKTSELM